MYPRVPVPPACGLAAAGQTYQPDFSSIAGFTNWNYGQFNVSAGQLSIGAVAFQVPAGITVASIQWDPNRGFGDNLPATWLAGR